MSMQDAEAHIKKAEAHVLKAMSSREAYEEMARKEAAVWSNQLVNPRLIEVRKSEQEAAIKLGLNDKNFSFPAWVRRKGYHFKQGLSVGCGAGRAERRLIELKVCDSFHGVDIAAEAVAEARQEAATLGYKCTYDIGDINFFDFGEAQYDLVVAQTSLHHLVYLENVFASIKRALIPGGILWINDYVGESQFQHSDLRLSIANKVLAEIPEEFRKNHLNNQTIDKVIRREPGTLVSPFESIRSGEILKIANEYFDFLDGQTWSAILHIVCPLGTRVNYLKNEESVALFRSIKLLDELLIESGVLDGTSASLVFQKALI
jgi:SAM-dependent methyltransferase